MVGGLGVGEDLVGVGEWFGGGRGVWGVRGAWVGGVEGRSSRMGGAFKLTDK